MTRVIQRPVRLVIVCVGAIALVTGFSLAASEFTNTDLSGWIEALSTLAALVAAITAAVYAAGAFRLESGRESRWVDSERRAQASLVAGWFNRVTLEVDRTAQDPVFARWLPSSYERDMVFLRNASDLPVSDVWVYLFQADERCGVMRYGVLPPATIPVRFEATEDLLRPANEELVEIHGAEYRVGIAFRDSAGQQWYRAPDGALGSTPPSHP